MVVSSNLTITTTRSVAQPGSAPGLGPGGPKFKSLYSDQFGSLAQPVERGPYKADVRGSIPLTSTNLACLAQW